MHACFLAERLVVTFNDITERTRAQTQVTEQLDELRRWQQATVGREDRILELKKEVNDLLCKTGQSPRYLSALERYAGERPAIVIAVGAPDSRGNGQGDE
jgi:hypothetical protein